MQMATSIENEEGEMIVKRVSVPIGLEELMEGLTKEVMMKKPRDIYLFAAEYFTHLLHLRGKEHFKGPSAKQTTSVMKASPRDSKKLLKQNSVHQEIPKKLITVKRMVPDISRSSERTKAILDKRKKRDASQEKRTGDRPQGIRDNSRESKIRNRSSENKLELSSKQRDRSTSSNRSEESKKTPRQRAQSEKVGTTVRNRSTGETPRKTERSVSVGKAGETPRKLDRSASTVDKLDKKSSKTKVPKSETIIDGISEGHNIEPTSAVPKEIQSKNLEKNDQETNNGAVQENQTASDSKEESIEKSNMEKVAAEKSCEDVPSSKKKENKDSQNEEIAQDETEEDKKVPKLSNENSAVLNDKNVEIKAKIEKKEEIGSIEETKDKIDEVDHGIKQDGVDEVDAVLKDGEVQKEETTEKLKPRIVVPVKPKSRTKIQNHKTKSLSQELLDVDSTNNIRRFKSVESISSKSHKKGSSGSSKNDKRDSIDSTKNDKNENDQKRSKRSASVDSDKTKKNKERLENAEGKNSFDSAKLKKELKEVEDTSKLSNFKTSYNPYVLRQEIKKASGEKEGVGKIDDKKVTIGQLTAALRIQAVWRGFVVRKNLKMAKTQEIKKEKTEGVDKMKIGGIEVEEEKETKLEKPDENIDGAKMNEMDKSQVHPEISIGQVAAALKIQSMWRGFVVRRTIKKKTGEAEDTRMSKETEGSVKEIKKTKPEKVNGTEAQVTRGKVEETKQKEDLKETNRSGGTVSISEVAAALKIQSIWRGFVVRKNVKIQKGTNVASKVEKGKSEGPKMELANSTPDKGKIEKNEEAEVGAKKVDGTTMEKAETEKTIVEVKEPEVKLKKEGVEGEVKLKSIEKGAELEKNESEMAEVEKVEGINVETTKGTKIEGGQFDTTKLGEERTDVGKPEVITNEVHVEKAGLIEEEAKVEVKNKERLEVTEQNMKEVKEGAGKIQEVKLEIKKTDSEEKSPRETEEENEEAQVTKLEKEQRKQGIKIAEADFGTGVVEVEDENVKAVNREETNVVEIKEKEATLEKDEEKERITAAEKVEPEKEAIVNSIEAEEVNVEKRAIKGAETNEKHPKTRKAKTGESKVTDKAGEAKIKRAKSEDKQLNKEKTRDKKVKKGKTEGAETEEVKAEDTKMKEVNAKVEKATAEKSGGKKKEKLSEAIVGEETATKTKVETVKTVESEKQLVGKAAKIITKPEDTNAEKSEGDEIKQEQEKKEYAVKAEVETGKLEEAERPALEQAKREVKTAKIQETVVAKEIAERIEKKSEEHAVREKKPDNKFSEAAAVLKIQSIWRGFAARRSVKLKKDEASKLESKEKKEEAEQNVGKEVLKINPELDETTKNKLVNAVVKIQTIWRGFNVRRLRKRGGLFGSAVEKSSPIKEELVEVKKRHGSAALKIQSLWRGYTVRKNIKEIDEKFGDEGRRVPIPDEDVMKAASKIQAGVRGYMVRKKMGKNTLNSISEEPDEDILKALGQLKAVPEDSPEPQRSETIKNNSIDDDTFSENKSTDNDFKDKTALEMDIKQAVEDYAKNNNTEEIPNKNLSINSEESTADASQLVELTANKLEGLNDVNINKDKISSGEAYETDKLPLLMDQKQTPDSDEEVKRPLSLESTTSQDSVNTVIYMGDPDTKSVQSERFHEEFVVGPGEKLLNDYDILNLEDNDESVKIRAKRDTETGEIESKSGFEIGKLRDEIAKAANSKHEDAAKTEDNEKEVTQVASSGKDETIKMLEAEVQDSSKLKETMTTEATENASKETEHSKVTSIMPKETGKLTTREASKQIDEVKLGEDSSKESKEIEKTKSKTNLKNEESRVEKVSDKSKKVGQRIRLKNLSQYSSVSGETEETATETKLKDEEHTVEDMPNEAKKVGQRIRLKDSSQDSEEAEKTKTEKKLDDKLYKTEKRPGEDKKIGTRIRLKDFSEDSTNGVTKINATSEVFDKTEKAIAQEMTKEENIAVTSKDVVDKRTESKDIVDFTKIDKKSSAGIAKDSSMGTEKVQKEKAAESASKQTEPKKEENISTDEKLNISEKTTTSPDSNKVDRPKEEQVKQDSFDLGKLRQEIDEVSKDSKLQRNSIEDDGSSKVVDSDELHVQAGKDSNKSGDKLLEDLTETEDKKVEDLANSENKENSSEAKYKKVTGSIKSENEQVGDSTKHKDNIIGESMKDKDEKFDDPKKSGDKKLDGSAQSQDTKVQDAIKPGIITLKNSTGSEGETEDSTKTGEDQMLEDAVKSGDEKLKESAKSEDLKKSEDKILEHSTKTEDNNVKDSKEAENSTHEELGKSEDKKLDDSAQLEDKKFQDAIKPRHIKLKNSTESEVEREDSTNTGEDQMFEDAVNSGDEKLKESVKSENLQKSEDKTLEHPTKSEDNNVKDSAEAEDSTHEELGKSEGRKLEESVEPKDRKIGGSMISGDNDVKHSTQAEDKKHENTKSESKKQEELVESDDKKVEGSRKSGDGHVKDSTKAEDMKPEELKKPENKKLEVLVDSIKTGDKALEDSIKSEHKRVKDAIKAEGVKLEDSVKSGDKKLEDLIKTEDRKLKDLIESTDNKVEGSIESGNKKLKDLTKFEDKEVENSTKAEGKKLEKLIESRGKKLAVSNKSEDNKEVDLTKSGDNKLENLTQSEGKEVNDLTKEESGKRENSIESNDEKVEDSAKLEDKTVLDSTHSAGSIEFGDTKLIGSDKTEDKKIKGSTGLENTKLRGDSTKAENGKREDSIEVGYEKLEDSTKSEDIEEQVSTKPTGKTGSIKSGDKKPEYSDNTANKNVGDPMKSEDKKLEDSIKSEKKEPEASMKSEEKKVDKKSSKIERKNSKLEINGKGMLEEKDKSVTKPTIRTGKRESENPEVRRRKSKETLKIESSKIDQILSKSKSVSADTHKNDSRFAKKRGSLDSPIITENVLKKPESGRRKELVKRKSLDQLLNEENKAKKETVASARSKSGKAKYMTKLTKKPSFDSDKEDNSSGKAKGGETKHVKPAKAEAGEKQNDNAGKEKIISDMTTLRGEIKSVDVEENSEEKAATEDEGKAAKEGKEKETKKDEEKETKVEKDVGKEKETAAAPRRIEELKKEEEFKEDVVPKQKEKLNQEIKTEEDKTEAESSKKQDKNKGKLEEEDKTFDLRNGIVHTEKLVTNSFDEDKEIASKLLDQLSLNSDQHNKFDAKALENEIHKRNEELKDSKVVEKVGAAESLPEVALTLANNEENNKLDKRTLEKELEDNSVQRSVDDAAKLSDKLPLSSDQYNKLDVKALENEIHKRNEDLKDLKVVEKAKAVENPPEVALTLANNEENNKLNKQKLEKELENNAVQRSVDDAAKSVKDGQTEEIEVSDKEENKTEGSRSRVSSSKIPKPIKKQNSFDSDKLRKEIEEAEKLANNAEIKLESDDEVKKFEESVNKTKLQKENSEAEIEFEEKKKDEDKKKRIEDDREGTLETEKNELDVRSLEGGSGKKQSKDEKPTSDVAKQVIHQEKSKETKTEKEMKNQSEKTQKVGSEETKQDAGSKEENGEVEVQNVRKDKGEDHREERKDEKLNDDANKLEEQIKLELKPDEEIAQDGEYYIDDFEPPETPPRALSDIREEESENQSVDSEIESKKQDLQKSTKSLSMDQVDIPSKEEKSKNKRSVSVDSVPKQSSFDLSKLRKELEEAETENEDVENGGKLQETVNKEEMKEVTINSQMEGEGGNKEVQKLIKSSSDTLHGSTEHESGIQDRKTNSVDSASNQINFDLSKLRQELDEAAKKEESEAHEEMSKDDVIDEKAEADSKKADIKDSETNEQAKISGGNSAEIEKADVVKSDLEQLQLKKEDPQKSTTVEAETKVAEIIEDKNKEDQEADTNSKKAEIEEMKTDGEVETSLETIEKMGIEEQKTEEVKEEPELKNQDLQKSVRRMSVVGKVADVEDVETKNGNEAELNVNKTEEAIEKNLENHGVEEVRSKNEDVPAKSMSLNERKDSTENRETPVSKKAISVDSAPKQNSFDLAKLRQEVVEATKEGTIEADAGKKNKEEKAKLGFLKKSEETGDDAEGAKLGEAVSRKIDESTQNEPTDKSEIKEMHIVEGERAKKENAKEEKEVTKGTENNKKETNVEEVKNNGKASYKRSSSFDSRQAKSAKPKPNSFNLSKLRSEVDQASVKNERKKDEVAAKKNGTGFDKEVAESKEDKTTKETASKQPSDSADPEPKQSSFDITRLRQELLATMSDDSLESEDKVEEEEEEEEEEEKTHEMKSFFAKKESPQPRVSPVQGQVLSTTTISLVHTGEFHDTPLPRTSPVPLPSGHHQIDATGSTSPISVQMSQDSPAGAPVLTSPLGAPSKSKSIISERQDDIADDVKNKTGQDGAQAPDKDVSSTTSCGAPS